MGRKIRSTLYSTSGRVITRLLPASRAAYWLVMSDRDPAGAAASTARLVSGLIRPSVADVVAAYLRGDVVFGVAGEPDDGWEWLRFDARSVITPDTVRISSRLRALVRRLDLQIRFDEDFPAVLQATRREGGTWITDGIADLYGELFDAGLAASVGAYRDGQLVGGLWGIRLGGTFGIMSVFHTVDHAGTVAQVAALDELANDGRWSLIESGQPNSHYERFGAVPVTSEECAQLIVQHLAARPS